MAYSVRCAHLRTTNWMDAMVASETLGANQRRNGPMYREVCSAESRSVDPTKMKIIQTRTGNQYLRNRRTKNETTRRALVLICRRDAANPHATARVRADFHGAHLGRTTLGI